MSWQALAAVIFWGFDKEGELRERIELLKVRIVPEV